MKGLRLAGPLVCSATMFMATTVGAQNWTYSSFDNGAWFEAHVTAPDRRVALHCGGRSPEGNPLPQTDEPLMTPDYTFVLTLAHPELGLPGNATQRGDLVVASGTQGFRLPNAVYDELNASGWLQMLRFGDALIGELRETSAIAIDAAGGRVATYAATGLRQSLDQAVAFCDARWAALGVQPPSDAQGVVGLVRSRQGGVDPTSQSDSASPSAAPSPNSAVRARAEAGVRRGCGGSYSANADAFLVGDVDGDGVEDIAVKWDAVTCQGNLPRPFCGASQCAVDMVLSSRVLGEGQGTLYAQAAELVPLSNGNMGLKLAGSLGMCRELGRTSCSAIWYWDGNKLAQLSVE
ncbi:MAG: hypothetical protein AAGK37_14965 [Pseudomonadota bacterium]